MTEELKQKIDEWCQENPYHPYFDYTAFEDLEQYVSRFNSFEEMEDELTMDNYDLSEEACLQQLYSDLELDELDEDDIDDALEYAKENLIIHSGIDEYAERNVKVNIICDINNESNYEWARPMEGWIGEYAKWTGSFPEFIEDNSESYSALVLLGELSLEDYFNVKNGDYKAIKVDEDTYAMDVDLVRGGDGGYFDTDFVPMVAKEIKKDWIHDIELETGKATIQSIYGLVDECWTKSYLGVV